MTAARRRRQGHAPTWSRPRPSGRRYSVVVLPALMAPPFMQHRAFILLTISCAVSRALLFKPPSQRFKRAVHTYYRTASTNSQIHHADFDFASDLCQHSRGQRREYSAIACGGNRKQRRPMVSMGPIYGSADFHEKITGIKNVLAAGDPAGSVQVHHPVTQYYTPNSPCSKRRFTSEDTPCWGYYSSLERYYTVITMTFTSLSRAFSR